MTADGVLVVSHDPHLNPDIARGPDGKWLSAPGPAIFGLKAAELARYDVGRLRPGSLYAARFPEQTPVDGTRIPTLAAVFALARQAGNETVRFNVETKIRPDRPDDTATPEVFADAVIKAVREAGMAGRATVQSFDWRTLRHVQKAAPEIATVYLTEDETIRPLPGGKGPSPWLAGLDPARYEGSVPRVVHAAGGTVWSPHFAQLTKESLAEARGLKVRVIPWTVNAPEDMARLIELGVDGLITDRPDLARPVMAAKGLALPAGSPVEP
jgi:glycerophosphoryl diester phosphodiesterase